MSSTIRTNIVVDQDLINEALAISGLNSRHELIHHALQELVRREKQKPLLALQGKVDWDANLDELRKTHFWLNGIESGSVMG